MPRLYQVWKGSNIQMVSEPRLGNPNGSKQREQPPLMRQILEALAHAQESMQQLDEEIAGLSRGMNRLDARLKAFELPGKACTAVSAGSTRTDVSSTGASSTNRSLVLPLGTLSQALSPAASTPGDSLSGDRSPPPAPASRFPVTVDDLPRGDSMPIMCDASEAYCLNYQRPPSLEPFGEDDATSSGMPRPSDDSGRRMEAAGEQQRATQKPAPVVRLPQGEPTSDHGRVPPDDSLQCPAISSAGTMPQSFQQTKKSTALPVQEYSRNFQTKKHSRFFCGGRLIFGPDVGSLFISTFLILTPSIVFCSQVASKITLHSPNLGTAVLIVAVVLTIWDLLVLILTSGRDPGIVPRNTRPPEVEEAFDDSVASMEWVNDRAPQLRLPRTKDVTVNGVTVRVKFCDTCLLYRPPRASHCSICNNCVQRFDHHCPWVGQCIGLRNYRFFFMFISSSTFMCIYVFAFSWVNILIRKSNGSLWNAMSQEVPSVVLIVYCFIAVWFVGGLTVFHLYLISTNQTTYENFRYRYDKKENPYNLGVFENFEEIFLSKIPPSLNNFRLLVAEEPNEIFSSSMRGDSIGPKATIDMELGNEKSGFPVDLHLPEILQGLDYRGIDDNLKSRENYDDLAFGSFVYPGIERAMEQCEVNATKDPVDQHHISIIS